MHYTLDDIGLQITSEAYWIAPTAVAIGNVRLEENASLWWGAVLRADNELITIGQGSNIQDNAVLHADAGFPLTIGPNVTVGHLAMLHGCIIGEGSLVGIGAVILNGARIGRNCLIGSKAFIAEGKEIPDNSVVKGIPGKVTGEVTAEQLAQIHRGTAKYITNWQRYKSGLVIGSPHVAAQSG